MLTLDRAFTLDINSSIFLWGSKTLPVATPTFDPVAGTYTSAQTVTISSATSGATIYYTTDGSTPDDTKTEYTAPISIGSSQTVKAIAIKAGIDNSGIGVAAYVINIALDSKHHFLLTEASGDCKDTGTNPTADGLVAATYDVATGGPPPPTSKCYTFSGASGQGVTFGNVADTQFTSADDFSVNVWIKTTGTTNQHCLVAHISGSYWGWQLMVIKLSDGRTNVPFFQMQLGGAYIQAGGHTDIDDGNWHMITYVHSGEDDGGSLYVDKVAETMHYSSAGPVSPDYSGTALALGHYGNANLSRYNGALANARIFVGKSLSQTEINGLYDNV